MQPLRPNGERARILKIMFWVLFFMEVISALGSFSQLGLLMDMQDDVEIDKATVNLNNLIVSAISLVHFAVNVGCGITFIRWFRRAYFNLHQRVKHLESTDGWAAGAWFVPIVNLVRPFKIMRELYVETRDLLAKHHITQPISLSTALVGFWWAAWIIMGLVGNINFLLATSAKALPELITTAETAIFSNLVGIPATLLAIKVVADYAKVEGLLFEVREDENVPAADSSS